MKNFGRILMLAGVLVSAITLLSFASKNNDKDKMPWSANRPLSWDDFDAEPNNGSKYGAITSSAIAFSFHSKGTDLQIDVKGEFFKNQSWVKKKARDADGLKHEQGHFDITEIYARKLRKECSQNNFTIKNVQNKLNDIYKSNAKAWEKEQSKYDNETQHHLNTAAQLQWNERIAKELHQLDAYSETHISRIMKF